MNFSAVILAGGRSRRMGRDKALIEFEGQTLLFRATTLARAAGASEVLVSGRPDLALPDLAVPILIDLEPGGGPIGGIERGLYHAANPLVFVMAVDMPRMTVEAIQHMVASWEDRVGVVPSIDGSLEPLAAIYTKRCHALALQFLQTARRSARDFAGECIRSGAVRELPIPPHLTSCFANWNSPSDIS